MNTSLKKAIGNAVIMWIVGIFPIVFSVIYYAIDESGKYGDIAMCASLFSGGLLCAFVMKKEHNTALKDYLSKPDPITLLLVISTSFFYVITTMYTLNRSALVGEPEVDTIKIVSLISGSTIVPIGEELIFRFSMLTLLLIASKGNTAKNIFSIIMISIMWMIMHFPNRITRVLDIMIIGFIIGFIYMKSKNILYCIIFHIIANSVTYSFAAVYHWFLDREYIFYISAVLLLFSAIMLFYRLRHKTQLKFAIQEY